MPDTSTFIDSVVAKLMSEPVSILVAERSLPDSPGIYAIFGDERAWSELGVGAGTQTSPLYVGKSESSLRTRDFRTHFQNSRTGQSTLRRSIAALLRDRLNLRGTPRNPKNPERFANFGLSPEHDQKLTDWMTQRLTLTWWVQHSDRSLAEVECELIARFGCPLCLTHCDSQWTKKVRDARAIMADDARRWTERFRTSM